jgi:hypothetical protein
MPTEADTCRTLITPKLQAAGWDGELQLVGVRKHLPDMLKIPPISERGSANTIISKFESADGLRKAVSQLQSLLYAA